MQRAYLDGDFNFKLKLKAKVARWPPELNVLLLAKSNF